MNYPKILGLGTACPKHCMSQDEALELFTHLACETPRQARLARALYRNAGVKNRHTVVPHTAAYTWCQPAEAAVGSRRSFDLAVSHDGPPDVIAGESPGPTTAERMGMYADFAADLAFESAALALSSSRVGPSQITHLVTVTCTGFDSPGVDVALINRLRLPPSTQRINVGFMGCHGAINGLRAARAIAQADPQARVLLVCVELCSLHYRFQWDDAGIIGNALFADGSAAAVLGQAPHVSESPGAWQLIDTGSFLIPNSSEAMSWKVGDHGFEMLLTSEVGEQIEASLAEWLVGWLEKYDVGLDDVLFWGVHPGGPRILRAVQNSLELSDEDLATSVKTLEHYGNMSSPTVLFVLNEFTNQLDRQSELTQGVPAIESEVPVPKVDRVCVLIAFGPGLVAEIALLRG